MPKAKRSNIVALTQVDPKNPREAKEKLVSDIRAAFDTYSKVYVLEFFNLTGDQQRELRSDLRDSKLILGRNHVMTFALGRDENESFKPRTYKLGRLLKNNAGLLFTNRPESEITEIIDAAVCPCSIHGGEIAPKTVVVPAGPLDRTKFAFSIEPELRKLGLPSVLRDNTIHVLSEYTICKEGSIINGAQARLLKHFGHELSSSKITKIAVWSKETNDIDVFEESYIPLMDAPNKK